MRLLAIFLISAVVSGVIAYGIVRWWTGPSTPIKMPEPVVPVKPEPASEPEPTAEELAEQRRNREEYDRQIGAALAMWTEHPEDAWEQRALPLLRWVESVQDGQGQRERRFLSAVDIRGELGLPYETYSGPLTRAIEREFGRLIEDGLVLVTTTEPRVWGMTWASVQLSGRAMRLLGLWPAETAPGVDA